MLKQQENSHVVLAFWVYWVAIQRSIRSVFSL